MKNMKNLSKRGLALFLALLMCLGMLDLSVFADDSVYEPVDELVDVVDGADVLEPPVEEPAYATVDDFDAACEAMGDADDEDAILAVLDGIAAVYANLSPEDQAAVADQWAYVQSYRESIDAGEPDEGIDTLNWNFEQGNINGKYKVDLRAYSLGRGLGTLYVPYGGSFTVTYSWSESGKCWEPSVSGTNVTGWVNSVNDADMSGISFSYTAPSTGNGSTTKGFSGGTLVNSASKYRANIQYVDQDTNEVVATDTYKPSKYGTATVNPNSSKVPAGYELVSTAGKSVTTGKDSSTPNPIIFYVKAVAQQVTLTYNANGGSNAPASETKDKGSQFTISSTTPTRTGYAFLGWSTNKDATEADYAAGNTFTINADTTLYAVWGKMITVTWLDEDGNQIDKVTVLEGEDYSDKAPGKPSETGKWGASVTDADGNITIRWEEPAVVKPTKVIITIKFVQLYEGDEYDIGVETVEVDRGDAYDVTEKAGNIPAGYKDCEIIETRGDVTGTADSDKTITVVFAEKVTPVATRDVPVTLAVQFTRYSKQDKVPTWAEVPTNFVLHYSYTDRAGEHSGELVYADAEQTNGTLSDPTLTWSPLTVKIADGDPDVVITVWEGNYKIGNNDEFIWVIFRGGDKSISGYNGPAKTISISSDRTTSQSVLIKNEYRQPKVTVTFDSNGGSDVASQTVIKGEKATKPTAPTRDGYSFKGWTLNGNEYDFDTAVTGDITLVAQWEENVPEKPTRDKINAMSDRLHINCVDNPAHNLLWTIGYDSPWVDRSADVTKGTDGQYHWSMTVNVDKWVKLDSDYLKTNRDSIGYDHSKHSSTVEPLVVNFTYDGDSKTWTMDSEPYIYICGPQITYKWVNYDNTQLYTATESACKSAEPAFVGSTPERPADDNFTYTFAGWSGPETDDKGNVTYKATYTPTPKTYTVTYKVDGEQVGTPAEVAYGTEVTVADKYVKEGYTVTDWATDDATIADGKFTMPAKDVTITATTSINSYTVTYKVDGEVIGTPAEVAYGTEVTVAEQYVKEGYTVTGWTTEDATIADGKFTMPANDVVITATTEINSYTVTYKVDGEQVGDVETYEFGAAVTIRDKYVKEGYTVSDWSRTEGFTMPAENVTITAATTINGYFVYYMVDGEQVGDVETYEFGAAVTIRDKYVKEGYTVSDWSRTEGFTMPAENVTITATTSINSYTVTYLVDGEQVGDVETYPYGAEVTIRDKHVMEGYTVGDWSRTEGFNMPAENVTITATATVIPVIPIIPDGPVIPDDNTDPDDNGNDVILDDPDVPLAENPEIEIPEEDVPLAGAPEIEIEDDDVPLADVPTTGDNSGVWTILTLFSGICLIWLALEDRKRKTNAK